MRDVVSLPIPKNLFMWWNFGSILGLILVVQIVSGLLLVSSFSVGAYSFDSLIHIIRDTQLGWSYRLIHCNGARLYFLFIYCHIARALYYQRPLNNIKRYYIGIAIYILRIAVAFVGYVLPWGQIRFWGATVITNLLSAVPFVGPTIVAWVWGGFTVSSATLTRFFTLHFIVPFLIALLSLVHLYFLHEEGRTNPLGNKTHYNKTTFFPYFVFKDTITWVLVIFLLSFFVFFAGYLLMDPENFIPANPLVTPIHIQPEWYFLFAYAILRAIPSKIGGVIGLVTALLILLIIPMNQKFPTISTRTRLFKQWLTLSFFSCFLLLTWLGRQPVEAPFIVLRQIISIFYFVFVLLI